MKRLVKEHRVCPHCRRWFLAYISMAKVYCSRQCVYASRRAATIANIPNRATRNANGCLEWQGRMYSNGYGNIGGRPAHRVVWEAAGQALEPGKVVMHSCDNRRCIEMTHLSLGTVGDNIRDMDSKGRRRSRRGEEHPRALVTVAQVHEIRRRCPTERYRAVARELGVDSRLVWRIATRRTWAWV